MMAVTQRYSIPQTACTCAGIHSCMILLPSFWHTIKHFGWTGRLGNKCLPLLLAPCPLGKPPAPGPYPADHNSKHRMSIQYHKLRSHKTNIHCTIQNRSEITRYNGFIYTHVLVSQTPQTCENEFPCMQCNI